MITEQINTCTLMTQLKYRAEPMTNRQVRLMKPVDKKFQKIAETASLMNAVDFFGGSSNRNDIEMRDANASLQKDTSNINSFPTQTYLRPPPPPKAPKAKSIDKINGKA